MRTANTLETRDVVVAMLQLDAAADRGLGVTASAVVKRLEKRPGFPSHPVTLSLYICPDTSLSPSSIPTPVLRRFAASLLRPTFRRTIREMEKALVREAGEIGRHAMSAGSISTAACRILRNKTTSRDGMDISRVILYEKSSSLGFHAEGKVLSSNIRCKRERKLVSFC